MLIVLVALCICVGVGVVGAWIDRVAYQRQRERYRQERWRRFRVGGHH